MSKLRREFFSVINGILPKSLTFKHGERTWRIPNVPRSMDRLMRPGRDQLMGKWVAHFVPEADIIIDIGANVGQSLILFRSLYPDAEYIGFEPNPVSSSMICKLISMNDLKHCRIFTLGVGPVFDSQELLVDATRLDDPTATMVSDCHSGTESRMRLPIVISPLQGLMPDLKLSEQTVIKIDVEGYEADVLKSLGDLAKQRPLIVSEVLAVWHGGPAARDTAVQRIHDWLDENKYSIVAVGHGPVARISDDFDAYIFVPAENQLLRKQSPRPK
jgi:FkbM family methyltransferase